jgi:hypothetical protein
METSSRICNDAWEDAQGAMLERVKRRDLEPRRLTQILFKYLLGEFHVLTAFNAPNATNTAARNSSTEL